MRRDASTQAGYDRAIVESVAGLLFAREWHRRGPHLVGISGLQGSGKSTFARQLAAVACERGVATVVLGLDDFYLGRRERARLARDVHPLLMTRGVPGTHDIAMLDATLRALSSATPNRAARIPRFDKGRDTRVPPSRWRRIATPPRLILFEGWCVGVPAQEPRALARPCNALERIEDGDAHWRTWVNRRLAGDYARLWRSLDFLIQLEAPAFSVVARWRDEQERALRLRRAPQAMSPSTLRRFLMHYERISRHALRTLPALADVRLVLDESRRMRRIAQRTGSTKTAVP